MITKNYKSIFSYLAALTTALFVVGCDQEENTDFSTLVPTAPTLSVTTSVSNKSLIEDDSVYEFTATLSTVQLVDVKLFITQVDGDATNGDDYTVDGSIVIPAGATSAKGKITILSDDLIEPTETVKIQIGDNTTANAALTPATMEFTIMNYTDGDLVLGLSWAMASATTDNSGEVIDPTDFADMRLLISSTPDNSGDIGEADGGSFESLVLPATTPDGVYYVVADFYDANNEIIRDLDLTLTLNQSGVINNDSEEFPAAVNSGMTCSTVNYILVKVIKSGNSYEIERVGEFKNPVVLSDYVGTWTGEDSWGYETQIVTTLVNGELMMTGIGFEWMFDAWGEEIQVATITPVKLDVNLDTGNFVIEDQYAFDTMYSGALYPYNVFGTGSINACNGVLTLEYFFNQDGWIYDGSDWGPKFLETITLN